jgi:hypothetical protein
VAKQFLQNNPITHTRRSRIHRLTEAEQYFRLSRMTWKMQCCDLLSVFRAFLRIIRGENQVPAGFESQFAEHVGDMEFCGTFANV